MKDCLSGKKCSSLLLLYWLCLSLAQASPAVDIYYDDFVYDDKIRTVQLYRGEAQASYPILFRGQSLPLTLEFDELLDPDELESNFFVDFISCDAFWNPSGVMPIEFYEGFTQKRIDLFRRSEFTKVPYVHYQFSFPQQNEGFKRSGNFILKVYRETDPDEVILTRRFVVVDRKASIQSTFNLQNGALQRILLDQLRFEVATPGLRVVNPANDLVVQVMQNFRWDNAFRPLQPRFAREDNFEYLINLRRAFGSGSEFRLHDIRSTRLFGQSVEKIEESLEGDQVYLFPDERRDRSEIRNRNDLNGSFLIQVNEWPNDDIQADYVNNLFRLEFDQVVDKGGIYLYGKMTDWQLQDRFELKLNPSTNYYEANVLLKQGLYDYQYVIYHPDQPTLDEERLEGIFSQSENFYTVLVYFRSPTDRTHQCIGYEALNYRD
ncbi:MAG: type IX secretion system plug protein domain-containing protein [Bacteroidota bacterium]